MSDFPPLFISALTGFVSGFALSIPVGPINLTIMNEGARRGFKWAAMIGLGAVLMEVIYCAIAFTSFSSIFQKGYVKAIMELVSFVFMLFLGVKLLMANSIARAHKIEAKIEEKLHPHSAFMIGFIRVMGNPGVLVFWVILAINFISREWVPATGPGKLSCIAGVAGGTGVWFFGLSYAVSRGHRKFSQEKLLKMEHGSGIGLLVLAAFHGGHIVWQMAKNKM